MNELKLRKETYTKKDGTDIIIDVFYIELDINGKIVTFDLKLDFTQSNFLKQFIGEE